MTKTKELESSINLANLSEMKGLKEADIYKLKKVEFICSITGVTYTFSTTGDEIKDICKSMKYDPIKNTENVAALIFIKRIMHHLKVDGFLIK